MMNREKLISKWLDNDLNDLELEAFKNLEDYNDLVKLNNSLQAFKADDYDTSAALETVLSTIKGKKQEPTHWFKPFMRVAAILAIEKENRSTPSWLNNESTFKSLPYKTIISEFERQYDVDITLVNIDSTELFTGSFTHNNLEVALKSISLPLHLTYSKTNHTIILKGE